LRYTNSIIIKKAQEYLILFFDRFETSKQTSDVSCRLAIRRSLCCLDWPQLIMYYFATKVFLTTIKTISKIKNLSVLSELLYILMTEIHVTRKIAI